MKAIDINVRVVLANCVCFKDVEPELMDQLVAQARIVTYQAGEVITHLGQYFHNLAVIADGQIELSVTNKLGKRHVLNVLGSGQLYGLIPMLDEKPFYYGAAALTSCSMILLQGDFVKACMLRSGALTMAILRIMCARSRDTFSALADQHLLSPTARLARHLITLATTYSTGASEIPTADFSQSELSQMLGISRQTLNQSMKQLESMGLVAKRYSKVTLPDLKRLQQLVADEL